MNRIILMQIVSSNDSKYYRLASHAYTSQKVRSIHNMMLKHCTGDLSSLISEGDWESIEILLKEHGYDVFTFTLEINEELLKDCILIVEENDCYN